MTKPKEYPLNRKGWAITDIRVQGGSWVKILNPIFIVKNDDEYILKCNYPYFIVGETVNPRTGEKEKMQEVVHVNTLEDIYKSIPRKIFRGMDLYFGTEDTKYKREIICRYVGELVLLLDRAPNRAELKKHILEKLHQGQIYRYLTSIDANSYMRRLMYQCMLDWLPTGSKGKRIIEFPPPYGYKDLFIETVCDALEGKPTGNSSIRLFFQLERSEEWPPPKKKRGRPKKGTEKK